jgi:hypothetical protein
MNIERLEGQIEGLKIRLERLEGPPPRTQEQGIFSQWESIISRFERDHTHLRLSIIVESEKIMVRGVRVNGYAINEQYVTMGEFRAAKTDIVALLIKRVVRELT